ncbi:MAG: hypothetical protein V1753_05835, partial [Pseudomonadota bacterium]
NSWVNKDLIRTLESLGAEVKIHGLTVPNCLSFFSEHYYSRYHLTEKKMRRACYYFIRNYWIRLWINRLEALLPENLKPFQMLRSKTIIEKTKPILHYDIDPILATFIARVQNFAGHGASGIGNIYVLNCMLGNSLVPLIREALKPYKGIPILNAMYDGQKETNAKTRIEAFFHQAKIYHERNYSGE